MIKLIQCNVQNGCSFAVDYVFGNLTQGHKITALRNKITLKVDLVNG